MASIRYESNLGWRRNLAIGFTPMAKSMEDLQRLINCFTNEIPPGQNTKAMDTVSRAQMLRGGLHNAMCEGYEVTAQFVRTAVEAMTPNKAAAKQILVNTKEQCGLKPYQWLHPVLDESINLN